MMSNTVIGCLKLIFILQAVQCMQMEILFKILVKRKTTVVSSVVEREANLLNRVVSPTSEVAERVTNLLNPVVSQQVKWIRL